jgi:hypothetical protein
LWNYGDNPSVWGFASPDFTNDAPNWGHSTDLYTTRRNNVTPKLIISYNISADCSECTCEADEAAVAAAMELIDTANTRDGIEVAVVGGDDASDAAKLAATKAAVERLVANNTLAITVGTRTNIADEEEWFVTVRRNAESDEAIISVRFIDANTACADCAILTNPAVLSCVCVIVYPASPTDMKNVWINLTKETITGLSSAAGAPIGIYRIIDPVRDRTGKWIDNTLEKRTLNVALAKILNRGGIIEVSTTAFARNVEPAANTIIRFPLIGARPRAKLALDYRPGRDAGVTIVTNETTLATSTQFTLGDWGVVAIIDRERRLDAAGNSAVQMVAVPATERRLTPAMSARFNEFLPQPVQATKDDARLPANTWFVKMNATAVAGTGDAIVYTPPTRARRMVSRPAGRAPSVEPRRGEIRFRANAVWAFNGVVHQQNATTGVITPEAAKGAISLTAANHVGRTIIMWGAASADGRRAPTLAGTHSIVAGDIPS